MSRSSIGSSRGTKAWSIAGAAIGLTALAWVLWRLDFVKLGEALAGARLEFLSLVPIGILFGEWVRAWKWGRILRSIKIVPTGRLFGAIMAGYLANVLSLVGVSPLLRAWLVGRLESLPMAAVLATVAIDRLVDGWVFLAFVAAVAVLAAIPADAAELRSGLVAGGAVTAALFVLATAALAAHKRQIADPGSPLGRLAAKLPERIRARALALLAAFAEGTVWPRSRWQAALIVAAALVMKLVATGHLLWAGLAFGVWLRAVDYAFLMVFLGFVVVLSRFVAIPGGFLLAGAFALELLGVDKERALAMVLVVWTTSMLSVTIVGAIALWRSGIAFGELRAGPQHGTA